MKLIDPDELERVLRPILKDESCPLHIAAEIDMNLDLMPKVDAIPVRHGRWVGSDSQCGIACSVCGVSVDDFCCSADYIDMNYQPNFCPNCGALMDGKDGEAHD